MYTAMLRIAISLLLLSTDLIVLGEANSETSCHVTIENCEYEVSLTPSNQCVKGQSQSKSYHKVRGQDHSKDNYSTDKGQITDEYFKFGGQVENEDTEGQIEENYNKGQGQIDGHSQQRSRSRRSTGYVELSEITTKIDSLSHKFNKMEQKLSREMKELSKRVLRGARKMEAMVKGGKGHRGQIGHMGSGRCPEGFVSVDGGGSCYMFSRFNTTWFEAIDLCTALDSDLVSLEELQEHFIVTFLIRNNPELQNIAGWWTSGSYISKSKQWVWKTTHRTQPISYIKWASNEPNELHEQAMLGLMLYMIDGYLWHDQIFTDRYNFVCEKQLDEW